MGNKSGDLIFQLIVIALLTGGSACTDENGTSGNTDTLRSDTSNTSDTDDSEAVPVSTDSHYIQTDCPTHTAFRSFNPAPTEGSDGDTDNLCISSAEPIVASSESINIQLESFSGSLYSLDGVLQFPDGLSEHIEGTPSIAVSSGWPQQMADAVVDSISQTDSGTSFRISISDAADILDELPIRVLGDIFINVQVSFKLDCSNAGMNEAVTVETQIPFYLCGTSDDNYMWLGPEEECTSCHPVVSEVSAIPVPSQVNDEGVLSGPMQASLQVIGHTAGAIWLWAQSSSTEATTFHWRTSSGNLLHRQGNLAIYSKQRNTATPALIQVAAMDSTNVAVAAFRTGDR